MNFKGSRLVVILSTFGLLTACSTGQVKSARTFDLSNPVSIEIAIAADNNNLQTDAIKDQVAQNLRGWDYPIVDSVNPAVSHLMTVLIGKAEHGSTPTGFSFSAGNSDPRSLEFQKADVLPITCKLETVKQTDESAELNMGFSDSLATQTKPDPKAVSDHISTVCFNLLREINWPVKNKKGEINSGGNSWMPEIRIETEEVPAKVSSPKSYNGDNVEAPSPSPKIETSRPVTKEINKDGRKIYIIHNKGNPITFKFGHDRK